MKKLGAILVTCCLGIMITACGNAPAAPAGSAATQDDGSGSPVVLPEAEVPAAGSAQGSGSASDQTDPNTRVYRDCSITVLGYSIRLDCDGDPAIRIQYQFTNNSQAPASFSTTVIPNAYQGSPRQMLHYTAPAEPDSEYSSLLTLLSPGESIVCAGYFKLLTNDQPVDLELKDLRDSSADALCRTLDIEDMPTEDYIEPERND